ncbi:MAG: PrgI family protein [Candidatus Parcubacteria bacterium]|nr:PrgI family protein [Candidatus Parcubacteria bacterium]
MQFKVPQFLDIEDKIFGPFTFREFVYLAGGAGLCFILYRLLGFYLGALPIVAAAGFSLALTFYRPNNKPFLNMVAAGFSYFAKDKLYVWERRKNTIKNDKLRITNEENPVSREDVRLSGSKLRDLAWSLDVLDLKK